MLANERRFGTIFRETVITNTASTQNDSKTLFEQKKAVLALDLEEQ